ncbi:hypothetical protein Syn7502_01469 [Synechococcus sp. PCC 7502]|uniref:hypothetical protein n=1 Tax=Synechococcus sp. PCC 7502 TaxID=1173263 RepID=UPI00029FD9CC|nr:hypothetical protein [Synechococcus sp. PCC 7502]AFY73537.1 hypothetical protein Syn7502_01469 [Synechococcus sp. PCC 7502]
MPDQIIEIPPNTEVVISITINPCHCDPSVLTESSPIEEIPFSPEVPSIDESETIVVIDPPLEQPIEETLTLVLDNPLEPEVLLPFNEEPTIIPTVETPSFEIESVIEVISTIPEVTPIAELVPEVQPVVEPTPSSSEALPIEATLLEVEPTPVETPITVTIEETLPEVQPVVETPSTSPVTLPIELPNAEVFPVSITPILVTDSPVELSNPIPIAVAPSLEVHNCKLSSSLTLAEFTKRLIAATKDLLYPSESDFPIEVLSKGLSTKIPPIKGIEVRNLERVFPEFLRLSDEIGTQAARWQALYQLIKANTVTTVWHYPVKQKRYTHEELVIMLHPQGTVGLRIKLVET